MAAQILALGNETLAERLLQDRSQNREKMAEQNRSVQASLDSE
jgi:phosphoribosylcarboxyaminoimidazole (NCAIR) mutase